MHVKDSSRVQRMQWKCFGSFWRWLVQHLYHKSLGTHLKLVEVSDHEIKLLFSRCWLPCTKQLCIKNARVKSIGELARALGSPISIFKRNWKSGKRSLKPVKVISKNDQLNIDCLSDSTNLVVLYLHKFLRKREAISLCPHIQWVA